MKQPAFRAANGTRTHPSTRGPFLAVFLVLVLAGSIVGPVVNAGSAAAGGIRREPIRMESTNDTGGKAAFRGRIVWLSRTRARVLGELIDVCPADVYGAFISIAFDPYEDAAVRKKYDGRRCDAPGTVPAKVGYTAARGETINAIYVNVCLRAHGTNFACDTQVRPNKFGYPR